MYDQMMKVSKGFRLVFIGMVLIVLGFAGAMLGFCIGIGAMGAGGGVAAAGFMTVVMGLMMVLLIGGQITVIIGCFFCLAVPEKAGSAKPMIYTSVAMMFIAIGLVLASFISGFAGAALPLAASTALSGGYMISSMGAMVFFLLFTKTVAEFVRRQDLAESAMSVLWLWVSTIACNIFGTIVVVVGGAAGGKGGMAGLGCVGGIISLVALIIAIVALIRFISLMKEMNEATAQHARSVRKKKKKPKRRVVEEEDEDDEEEDDEDEDDDDDDEDDRRRRRRRR